MGILITAYKLGLSLPVIAELQCRQIRLSSGVEELAGQTSHMWLDPAGNS
jgi:hypothetical protein